MAFIRPKGLLLDLRGPPEWLRCSSRLSEGKEGCWVLGFRVPQFRGLGLVDL